MLFRLANTESTKHIQFKNTNQVYWGPEFYKQ